MAGELGLQVTPLRTAVSANASPQLTYVLIQATPTLGQLGGVQMPLNLSLVLDRSGSMQGAKIENLRQAVHMLIEQLQPNDFVSIVLFDEKGETALPSTPAQDKARLHTIADQIQERGGTQMSLGLQKGLEEVFRNYNPNDPNRIHRILLLTDGMSWGDDDQIKAQAQQAGQYRIPIVALGLGLPGAVSRAPGVPPGAGPGDDWNEALLEQVGQLSGGSSDLIKSPPEIVRVFQSVVRSAQGAVIRNAQLLLRLTADVSARQVWRVVPLIQNLSHRAISARDVALDLGDIDKNTGAQVVVELVLPTRGPGTTRVAQAEVSYDVPTAGLAGEKVRADVVLEFNVEGAPNPQVANLVEKVTAHKLQTQALQDAQAGNIPGATMKLQQAATRLLSIGENELAQVALNEAQNLQQQGQMTSSGTKRLKYETRKLTQPLDELPSS